MICPICDAAVGLPEFRKPGLTVVRCKACGFRCADLDEWKFPYFDKDYYVASAAFAIDPSSPLQRHRVAGIRCHVKTGRSVDLGCGRGETTIALSRAGFDATGVDESAVSINDLRSTHPGIHWVCASLHDFVATDETFDVVSLYHVLEHIPRPQNLCESLSKLLTPQGILVIEVPNVSGRHARLFGYKWQYWLDHHVNYFDLRSLRALLERVGLRLESFETKYHFGWPQGVPWRDSAHALLNRVGFGDVLTTYWRRV